MKRPALFFPLQVPALFVAACCLLPLAYLLIRAGQLGTGFFDLLVRPRTMEVFINSVLLTLAVTGSASIIGVLLAWLTVRTQLPGRRFWMAITCLPLVLPSYVGAFALIATLGPHGALQRALAPWGVEALPSLYGFPGAWFALTLFTYPYVQLSVQAGLRGLDPALEDAARALGRSSPQVFRQIILPHLRPAMAAGALLSALYTLSDFGAVSLLQFNAFTRAIYVHYTAALDRSAAAVLALLLVALTLVILWIELRTRGRARYYRSASGTPRRAAPRPLGRWKIPALLFCGFISFFALVLPLAVIGYWLFQGREMRGSGVSLLMWHSFSASSLAAIACAMAAIPVVILSVHHPRRLHTAAERCAYLGHALPGIVVALALVFFGARALPWLYQSFLMLILAYVILFLPLALSTLRASMLQISPRLEEAARSLGKTQGQTWRTVTFPLLRTGIWTALALVFLTCMKELPATLILGPTGFQTLATRIWAATEEAFFARAAIPALVLVAVSAISLWMILHREEKGVRS